MDTKEKIQYEKLVLSPVSKIIPKLALPTVISMMVTMIYNLVDSFFVGKLSTSASASVGILVSVLSIYQAIGFMCGHGSGSRMSVSLGESKHKQANIYVSTAFYFSIIITSLLTLILILFITPLMKFLGSTPTILPYSKTYGYYILLSGPFLASSCVLNNILRYEGKATLAMIGLVFGGFLNMLGDPLLMFGLNLGIHGAGLSTLISQMISFTILLYMFLSKKTITKISLINFKPFSFYLPKIIENGMPSLLRQLLNSFSMATLNRLSMPYGDAVIAAMTIVSRIIMLFSSTMIGIGQALQPIAAYNIGAKKYKRIRESFKFTLILGEIVLGIFAIIGFIFSRELIGLFRNDINVIKVGSFALKWQCISLVLSPISICANMLFQSIGKAKIASILASLRSGLCFIPTIIILSIILGLFGIQISQFVSDIITSIICIPILIKYFKKLPNKNIKTIIDKKYEESL